MEYIEDKHQEDRPEGGEDAEKGGAGGHGVDSSEQGGGCASPGSTVKDDPLKLYIDLWPFYHLLPHELVDGGPIVAEGMDEHRVLLEAHLIQQGNQSASYRLDLTPVLYEILNRNCISDSDAASFFIETAVFGQVVILTTSPSQQKYHRFHIILV